MKADGDDVIQLTNSQANNWGPSWSSDGSNILFSSERNGNTEIYVMNADGRNQIRLTKDKADDEIAVWQP